MRSWRRVFTIVAIALVAVLGWSATATAQTESKLTASDAAATDNFGYSVSISGEYVIVGARFNDDDGSSSGSAYIFSRSDTTWTQQAKLTASDEAANDEFGYSVSISGDNAIVGAQHNDDDGSNSGSAYIFNRSGTSWSEQAKHIASDAAADDEFGYSVSISGDHAIVGAFLDDDAGNASGSAYVYTLTPTPLIEVSPVAVTMGPVPVNLSSADVVKVKNTGTAALGVSAIAVTGADAGLFTATPSALTLAGGDSANVHVTFTPTSVVCQGCHARADTQRCRQSHFDPAHW